MAKLDKFQALKDKLDEIDRRVYLEVFDGFYQSRLKILMGMWEKGEAIAEFTPLNSTINFSQLERETGRQRESLKSWHDLYLKYPSQEKYLEIAKNKAEKWTQKALGGLLERTRELPPPKGKSQVIYADPPWDYANTGFDQSARQHYPTISTLELCKPETWLKLPINEILQDKSVLFLWVTYPFAKEGFQICEAWGFQYKAQMVWVKNTTTGMGWFVTPKHELLYIATRGQELHPAIKPDSVLQGEEYEATGHSHKPEAVYKIIEQMYTGPYIELFARKRRPGWESWGNEVQG